MAILCSLRNKLSVRPVRATTIRNATIKQVYAKVIEHRRQNLISLWMVVRFVSRGNDN